MKCLRVVIGFSWLSLGVFALVLSGCGEKSTPDAPRMAQGVAMRDVIFFSTSLGREMPYRVYLPERVDPGRRLAVVYLLHGGGGSFRDWSNGADVAQYALRGLILVMPEGKASYWMNSVQVAEDRYEDYLTKDLVADVEARFPAAAGREHRAIVGISMGGFAAVELALTRPELYGFAGGISPAINVPGRRFSWNRVGQWWGFRRIFGPVGSEVRRARDPFVLVETAPPGATPFLYLTAGEWESLLEPNRRFAARLQAKGFAYEFHTKPGVHDWAEWDAQIPGCFEKLMEKLKVV